ncbi:MAG: hypothetical protein HY791_20445 [Deltaproteobacteria bacterium]|nr:hypothetical protein [Deltaproteobacteria bacterium]
MLRLAALDLAAYIGLYPPRAPARPAIAADECRQLEAEDGVGILPFVTEAMVPGRRPGQPDGRHLWVIVPDEVRVISEIAPDVRPPPLSLGVAKHTNLTGGGLAACGGELWIDPTDNRKLYANGGSGRYPPKTPKQLEHAVSVLASFGFTVVSAGWSEDNDCAERVFR